MFRLSAPIAAANHSPPTDGAFPKAATVTDDARYTANGGCEKATGHASDEVRCKKASPSMLPPPGARPLNRNGKAADDGTAEVWAQPKVVGRKTAANAPSVLAVDSEQEAMLRASLPSTFGAARDKPLGKRADREAHIVRGAAGAVISGASGRFATGRKGGSATKGKPAVAEEAMDKAEARRQRQAEIAAITAELARPDSSSPDEMGDERADGSESSSPVQFKPGGWRHASGHGAGRSAATKGRKKLQHTRAVGERLREEEKDEDPMEEEEEEEEDMTEEERIKLVVRRLGLPVSHEVQLSGHRKGVMALALDRAGGRVATGSNDYKVGACPAGGSC